MPGWAKFTTGITSRIICARAAGNGVDLAEVGVYGGLFFSGNVGYGVSTQGVAAGRAI